MRSRFQYCHRSEEHTSELQSLRHLVCRLLLEKKITTASVLVGRSASASCGRGQSVGEARRTERFRKNTRNVPLRARQSAMLIIYFFLNDGATPGIDTFSLRTAFPI